MGLAIKINATKGLSPFSVSTVSVFEHQKFASLNQTTTSTFLEGWGGLINIHRKRGKFRNSIYWRHFENPELFYSDFLYGSIYSPGNLYHKNIFFLKLRIGTLWVKKGPKWHLLVNEFQLYVNLTQIYKLLFLADF